jgi:hypothetical protein
MPELKRKVTLKRKDAASTSVLSNNRNGRESNDSKGKKWFWLIPALLVVGGAAWFLTKENGNGTIGTGREVTVEQPTPRQPSDNAGVPASKSVATESDNATADETPAQTADATTSAGTESVPSTGNEAAQPASTQPSQGKSENAGSQQQSGNKTADSKAASTTATQKGSQTAASTSKNALSQTTTTASQPLQQSSTSITGDVEKLAKEVIRGNYGVGLERKQLLGNRYKEIQNRVNQIYIKNGNSW